VDVLRPCCSVNIKTAIASIALKFFTLYLLYALPDFLLRMRLVAELSKLADHDKDYIDMRKSRLSIAKQEKLLEYFVVGSTARTAASLVSVNKSTASYYFLRLRKSIFAYTEKMADEYFKGEIEVDESYFGGVRKGKRGRGAAGKIPVFGLLKRGGKVFTKIIANAKSETLAYNSREGDARSHRLYGYVQELQCA